MRWLALFLIAIVLAAMAITQCNWTERSSFTKTKYRVFLLNVDGPKEWKDSHSFSIDLDGKTVTLPVLLRAGTDHVVQLRAGPEQGGFIWLGNAKLPVKSLPTTDFRINNAFGGDWLLIGGNTAFVTQVVITPWSVSPELGLNATLEEIKMSNQKLEAIVRQLTTQGKVIDIAPALSFAPIRPKLTTLAAKQT